MMGGGERERGGGEGYQERDPSGESETRIGCTAAETYKLGLLPQHPLCVFVCARAHARARARVCVCASVCIQRPLCVFRLFFCVACCVCVCHPLSLLCARICVHLQHPSCVCIYIQHQ